MTDEMLRRFGGDSFKTRTAFSHTTQELFRQTLRNLKYIEPDIKTKALNSLDRLRGASPEELAVLPDVVLTMDSYRLTLSNLQIFNRTFEQILAARPVKK